MVCGVVVWCVAFFLLHCCHMGFDLIDATTTCRAPIAAPDVQSFGSRTSALPTAAAITTFFFILPSAYKEEAASFWREVWHIFSFSTDITLMLSLPTASGTRTTPASIVFVSPLASVVLI